MAVGSDEAGNDKAELGFLLHVSLFIFVNELMLSEIDAGTEILLHDSLFTFVNCLMVSELEAGIAVLLHVSLFIFVNELVLSEIDAGTEFLLHVSLFSDFTFTLDLPGICNFVHALDH